MLGHLRHAEAVEVVHHTALPEKVRHHHMHGFAPASMALDRMPWAQVSLELKGLRIADNGDDGTCCSFRGSFCSLRHHFVSHPSFFSQVLCVLVCSCACVLCCVFPLCCVSFFSGDKTHPGINCPTHGEVQCGNELAPNSPTQHLIVPMVFFNHRRRTPYAQISSEHVRISSRGGPGPSPSEARGWTHQGALSGPHTSHVLSTASFTHADSSTKEHSGSRIRRVRTDTR